MKKYGSPLSRTHSLSSRIAVVGVIIRRGRKIGHRLMGAPSSLLTDFSLVIKGNCPGQFFSFPTKTGMFNNNNKRNKRSKGVTIKYQMPICICLFSFLLRLASPYLASTVDAMKFIFYTRGPFSFFLSFFLVVIYLSFIHPLAFYISLKS